MLSYHLVDCGNIFSCYAQLRTVLQCYYDQEGTLLRALLRRACCCYTYVDFTKVFVKYDTKYSSAVRHFVIALTAIRPAGFELFHADRRTDRHDEANCHFLQIMRKAPRKTFFLLSDTLSGFGTVGRERNILYWSH